MKTYYLITCLLLSSFTSFSQRPKAVTDINRRGGSFPVGIKVINTGEELVFNAYDPKMGNQLFIYDGKSLERVSRFTDSYKNGRFEPEQQSRVPLGAITSGYIPYKKSVIFSAMGELTKPSVYRYVNGGVDKIKTNLQTSDINCRVGESIYFLGTKLNTNDETGEKTWEKGIYKIDGGESIQKLRMFDELAPRIQSMCGSNGMMYFITKKKLYSYDGNSYQTVQTFERELLEKVVSIDGEVYVWGYRNRKKALLSAKDGRVLTSRLVKNRDRIGVEPPSLNKNDTKVYVEDAYHRYYDLVLANKVNFSRGEFPAGIFTGRAKVDEIESFTWFEDYLLICMKEKGKKEYNLWQYGEDTLIKYRFRRIRDIRSINYLKGKLYFTADGGSVGRELYQYIPYKAPELRDQNFSSMEKVPQGTSIGTVRVDELNGKIAKFKIVGGNPNDAFEIDEFSGELKVKNANEINYKRNPAFNLVVEVDNRHLASTCKIGIELQESKYLNRRNLQERFLFFPDFGRSGVLKTNVLNDGETIEIYNLSLRMIDKTTVQNGEIMLGNYPPGIYYLNANNGRRNFVQKMEMN